MCGIFFACSSKEYLEPSETVLEALRARGPDNLDIHHAQKQLSQANGSSISIPYQTYYLTFVSSILSLRGDHICSQPLIDGATQSVLCWNGEAWKIDGSLVGGNDTQQIFRLLLDASVNVSRDQASLGTSNPSRIAKVLTCVAGPYAFVYYDAVNSTVYYGRDRLGRRSLVRSAFDTTTTQFSIASVQFETTPVLEVKTDGIHCVDLNGSEPDTKHIPWPTADPSANKAVPNPGESISLTPSHNAVRSLIQHLSEAVRLRITDVPTYTINTGSSSTRPSRIAILFSGGLDCTLLARATHDVLHIDKSIDLLNVAFENPRTVRAAAKSSKPSESPMSPYETCPDRMTARSSFAELITTCPNRTWRFVSIDVPYSDTLAHRATVIKLMSPHNTEMDLSITLALYFASRAQGQSITCPTSKPTPYTTTSRVLLSGLGADELFGGYARHAASFNRTGYDGLTSELELDFKRIGTRNLGRDDRVMAHWGREVRYPYLDEDFVAFALALPVWEKTGFRPGMVVPKHFEGSGGRVDVNAKEDLDPAKMLLRLAAWELGMRGVAGERKRAIQFGARTAKMEGGKTKGTDLLIVE